MAEEENGIKQVMLTRDVTQSAVVVVRPEPGETPLEAAARTVHELDWQTDDASLDSARPYLGDPARAVEDAGPVDLEFREERLANLADAVRHDAIADAVVEEALTGDTLFAALEGRGLAFNGGPDARAELLVRAQNALVAALLDSELYRAPSPSPRA